MATDYSIRQGNGWPEVEELTDFGALLDSAEIGEAEEYGFESLEEMYDFWTGQGEYSDQAGWAKVDDHDLERMRRELQQTTHKCPSCQDELIEYLEQGAMRGEVDKDPAMEVQYWTEEHDSFQAGVDEVRTHNYMIYCEEHPETFAQFEVRENVGGGEE